jgi:serine/threonine protein kinase
MALSKVSRLFTIDELKSMKEKEVDELIVKDPLCAGDQNKLLKDFKNIVEIGKGGFGAVYMAYDRHLKKNVAIK